LADFVKNNCFLHNFFYGRDSIEEIYQKGCAPKSEV